MNAINERLRLPGAELFAAEKNLDQNPAGAREAVEEMIAGREAEFERTKNPVRRAKLQEDIAQLRSALDVG